MIFGDAVRFLVDPANYRGGAGFPARFVEHLQYSLLALVVAVLLAVPVGAVIGHTGRGETLVVNVANALRSLPTLGLMFILITSTKSLGIGPLVLALVVLAVPPVLLSTLAGVAGVDPEVVDAARGVGMTERQVLTGVELPNGLPVIAGGVRSAALQVVATAPIAALVALGSLGSFIIDGLGQRDYPQMAAGALLVAALAVAVDLVLSLMQRLLVPAGLRPTNGPDRAAANAPVVATHSERTTA